MVKSTDSHQEDVSQHIPTPKINEVEEGNERNQAWRCERPNYSDTNSQNLSKTMEQNLESQNHAISRNGVKDDRKDKQLHAICDYFQITNSTPVRGRGQHDVGAINNQKLTVEGIDQIDTPAEGPDSCATLSKYGNAIAIVAGQYGCGQRWKRVKKERIVRTSALQTVHLLRRLGLSAGHTLRRISQQVSATFLEAQQEKLVNVSAPW